MKIAVLGATDMIGNHTVRAALARGHEVLVVHRKSSNLKPLSDLRFESVVADLDDVASMRAAFSRADAVIHSAGYYPPQVPAAWRKEVAIAHAQMARFLSACEGLKLHRIVFIGSVVAVALDPEGKPATEALVYSEAPRDRTPYLQIKWALDADARAAATRGLPTVVGIPGMCLGEYDQGPTTGRLIVEVLNRRLPGFVHGKRNVVYTGDAGVGMVLAAESGRIGERYLFAGTNITLAELIAKVAQLGSVPVPRFGISPRLGRFLARVLEAKYRWFGGAMPQLNSTAIAVSSGQFLDGRKAQDELGFRAQVSLDEAIERAIRWFRQAGYLK
jgi:dihydroflavonol-4-reductase